MPWRATEDGFVTDDNLDWYRRFAKGRPGVLVVEATGVRDIPSGPLMRIGHDRFLPGLRKLVETVREASEGQTKLLIQIIDFLSVRRRPEKENTLRVSCKSPGNTASGSVKLQTKRVGWRQSKRECASF